MAKDCLPKIRFFCSWSRSNVLLNILIVYWRLDPHTMTPWRNSSQKLSMYISRNQQDVRLNLPGDFLWSRTSRLYTHLETRYTFQCIDWYFHVISRAPIKKSKTIRLTRMPKSEIINPKLTYFLQVLFAFFLASFCSEKIYIASAEWVKVVRNFPRAWIMRLLF